MTDEAAAQTHGFQAEVKQLLHLMVHSLYSDREIFLRELISNASDANDKLRFAAIGDPALLGNETDLEIVIEIDTDRGELSVRDNGIGMSREEIIEQLGTIAHSGTGRFLNQLTGDERNDSKLIGQFGVGFYSSFIVADQVEVTSRRADMAANDGVSWKSDGKGEFVVAPIERDERGTEIRLRLKADAKEFLDEFRIKGLIRKYSDHISFPVKLRRSGSDADAEEVINHAQALWTRPRNDVSDEEYSEFYKHVTHDFTEPLLWSHNRVEGKREYTSLLYIPAVAPIDLWNREAPKGLKLYVQRVFITDNATYFLPLYLRFVRGIVDSRDLSLNVSRELLQQDPNVSSMRNALTKRVIAMLEKLAENEPDKYAIFWAQFGDTLKEGLAEDLANQQALTRLLRFNSTASDGDEQGRSLPAYLKDADEQQDKIYYLIAESPVVARSSPHLEVFRERGIEVLLLTDRIDEWMLQHLTEFDGKQFQDVSRGALDFGESEAGQAQDDDADKSNSTQAVLDRVRETLDGQVSDVRVSTRLKESAACLVLGEQDLGYQMREMLKAAGHEAPETAPALELNPAHPLVQRLMREPPREFELLSYLLLDHAKLAEGRALSDPAAYLKRINELMLALGLSADGNGSAG